MKTTTSVLKPALLACLFFLLTHSSVFAGCTLTASITSYSNVLCNGFAKGSATVAASGGTKPYTYSWSPSGGTNATASNLPSGSYTVTVKDSTGCSTTATVFISQPPPLSVTVTVISKPTCDSCCNGVAMESGISGGMAPYTGHWCNVTWPYWSKDTTICAGTCYFCVVDANGCQSCDSITMTAPTGLNNITNSNQFDIYPNPGNGIFIVQANNQWLSANDQIEVYNMLGEKIYVHLLSALNPILDLSTQPTGIYFYRITSESGDVLSKGKLIKE